MRRRYADPVKLTAEQRALFKGVSDAPSEAAIAALREHSTLLRHLTADEVLSLAVIGGMEATASHRSAAGSLRQWVYFGALHRVLDSARAEHKRQAKIVTLTDATTLVHWRGLALAVEADNQEPPLSDKPHTAPDNFDGHAALRMTAAEPLAPSDAEEELERRREAAWAGNALRTAMKTLPLEQRWILERHFRAKQPLAKIAAHKGVKPPQYRTFVRDFRRLLATLEKHLRALGMTEMPEWSPDISGSALGGESSVAQAEAAKEPQ
jgi:DNA-directed RNA polymerase specialized sigma24 family protein